MKQQAPMIPLEEALDIVERTLAGMRPRPETVPVRRAVGRVLLEDQLSRLDLPPFDKSAMDGYAVLAGDERDEYRLLETIAAGSAPSVRLEPGTAVKVMTGAPVPEGAGKVIIVEDAEERGGRVLVRRRSSAANICWRGEDVRRGDLVVKGGTVLRPLDVANLIACGVGEVAVARRPRLAVISTGDEIVDSPEQLGPGRIMNVNGPMLAALGRRYGLEVVSEVTLPDDRLRTEAALRDALDAADIVALSGGVSVGDFDFVTGALGEAGLEVHFQRVAVKPGKPMTYATAPGKQVFGLPGNPVSAYLTFHLFVLRAAARALGTRPPLREVPARMAEAFARRKAVRREYVPCRMDQDGVRAVEYHGSGHLGALLAADGFFIVPVGVRELRPGDDVAFLPMPEGWR